MPVALDLELDSEDGRIHVTGGDADVGGFPAGPLAEIITSAIVVQL